VLFWETGLHSGSSGCGDAAFDGTEPTANIIDAHSDPVPLALSKTHRFCHEHPTEANNETGNMCKLHLFDVPNIQENFLIYENEGKYRIFPSITRTLCTPRTQYFLVLMDWYRYRAPENT
jgi:hypothetical protein